PRGKGLPLDGHICGQTLASWAFGLSTTSASLPLLFFSNAAAPTEIYTLSLHDALPICELRASGAALVNAISALLENGGLRHGKQDRKSTRLNSSHLGISYAVFCLKKKKTRSRSRWRRARSTPSSTPTAPARARPTDCSS